VSDRPARTRRAVTGCRPGEVPIRLAVVGCGRVAEEGHAPRLAENGFDLVSVVDPSPARRDLIGERYGIPGPARHADVTELSAGEADAVLVATPPHVRPAIVEAACRLGMHVLCEKPLATTLAGADAALDAVRLADRVMVVLQNYPHLAEFVMAEEVLSRGELGRLHTVVFRAFGTRGWDGVAEYEPRWRDRPSIGGGGRMIDMGIHGVCLADRWFGAQADSASAEVFRTPGGVDARCIAVYRYGDRVAVCEIAAGPGPAGVELLGTDGFMSLHYPPDLGSFAASPTGATLATGSAGLRHIQLGERPQFPDAMYDRAREAIDSGRPNRDGEEARRQLEAVHAAYLSAHERRFVDLPLPADHPLYSAGVRAIWDG
jgi:predicted dehydrogenase